VVLRFSQGRSFVLEREELAPISDLHCRWRTEPCSTVPAVRADALLSSVPAALLQVGARGAGSVRLLPRVSTGGRGFALKLEGCGAVK